MYSVDPIQYFNGVSVRGSLHIKKNYKTVIIEGYINGPTVTDKAELFQIPSMFAPSGRRYGVSFAAGAKEANGLIIEANGYVNLSIYPLRASDYITIFAAYFV